MRRWIAAATLALTLACSRDGTASPTRTIAGTYALQTIDGSGLPYTFVSGSDSVTVTTDTLFVGTQGAWLESYTYRQTFSGRTTTGTHVDQGSWFTEGNQIEFDSVLSGTVVYVGTFTDSALSLSDGTFTQIFVR